jgi:hypothetical protein
MVRVVDAIQQARDVLKIMEDCALALGVDLPLPHRVSVTDQPVIACAETRVAVLNIALTTHPVNTLACDVLPTYTLSLIIARSCQVTFDESTGAEVTASLERASELMSRDQEVLAETFEAFAADPVTTPGAAMTNRLGTIVSTVTSGLAITTMTAIIS